MRPFLRWAGGKRRLLKQFSAHFPTQFRRYFEPFLGGGAVFFHLSGLGEFAGGVEAELSDLNEELINCYVQVKERPEQLIELLRCHQPTSAYYYKLREMKPFKLTPLERASRFIYLNKTCFNGLYRVNSAGEFNVPYGKYKNPVICDEAALRLASAALQSAKLSSGTFEKSLKMAKPGDFVYLDPPSNTSGNAACNLRRVSACRRFGACGSRSSRERVLTAIPLAAAASASDHPLRSRALRSAVVLLQGGRPTLRFSIWGGRGR